MAILGITLRVTHTGKAGGSILLSDLGDGTDQLSYRKVGPVYVPIFDATGSSPGYIDLSYTTDVSLSYSSGAIRHLVDDGYLTTTFYFGDELIERWIRTTGTTNILETQIFS